MFPPKVEPIETRCPAVLLLDCGAFLLFFLNVCAFENLVYQQILVFFYNAGI